MAIGCLGKLHPRLELIVEHRWMPISVAGYAGPKPQYSLLSKEVIPSGPDANGPQQYHYLHEGHVPSVEVAP